MKHPIKKSAGIGLIEVLITTLVVALGLLAVASLQGNLMSGSSLNKTRAEALQLANLKMEELRDRIVKATSPSATTDYDAILSGRETAIISGTNENFFRYWLVDTLPTAAALGTALNCGGVVVAADKTAPARKRLCVNVAWKKAAYDQCRSRTSNASWCSGFSSTSTADATDEQVTVQTVLSYDKVAVSYSLASAATPNTGATIGSPTTNAGSSFDINDSTTVTVSAGAANSLVSSTSTNGEYIKRNTGTNVTQGSIVYKCTGEDPTVTTPFIYFENGLYTRRFNYDQDANGFKEVIELAVSNNDNLFGTGLHSCTRKVRYTGGIIIPIKGRVYNTTDSSGISVLGLNSSESGVFCAYTATTATTSSFSYACYVGGNCRRQTAGGTIKEDTSNTADSAGRTGIAKAIAANVNNGGTVANASTGENTIVTQCPYANGNTTAPIYGKSGPTVSCSSADQNAYTCLYDSIGHGGWRGNVGLLGLITGNTSRTSCFAGTVSNATNNTPEAEKPATARLYKSLRYDSSQTSPKSDEGLNKSYLCQDFLIVGTSGQNNCTATNIGALKLASKTIVRAPGNAAETAYTFTGTPIAVPNTVDFNADKSSCHIITGSPPSGVTLTVTTPVGVLTSNGEFECTVKTTNNTYECIGTSKETNVTILAAPGGTGFSCTTTLSTGNINPTCNLTATNNTSVSTLSGTITYSNASPTELTAINPTASCVITGGSNKSGYICKTTGTASSFTATVSFTDGTGNADRAVCRSGDNAIYTTSPATNYSNSLANQVRNFTLKGGSSITCP